MSERTIDKYNSPDENENQQASSLRKASPALVNARGGQYMSNNSKNFHEHDCHE